MEPAINSYKMVLKGGRPETASMVATGLTKCTGSQIKPGISMVATELIKKDVKEDVKVSVTGLMTLMTVFYRFEDI